MKENAQSAAMRNNGHTVRLSKPNVIDDGVTLGYAPARGNGALLYIGPGARLRSGTVIYGGSRIGRDLETGHNVIIREENAIGDKLRIWSNSIIDYGCRIGNNVRIHSGVYICQFTTIEDDVFIGPGVILANDIHPGCPDAIECMQGPRLKRGAQIGVNCSVLPRVVIGELAVIGAGSLVTKDIPPGVVAYGNPAQVVCKVEDLKCSTGLRDKPYDNLLRSLRECVYH
jgi:acetyltransferase-like isoleucine patch superfamily enzyme